MFKKKNGNYSRWCKRCHKKYRTPYKSGTICTKCALPKRKKQGMKRPDWIAEILKLKHTLKNTNI